MIGWMNDGRMDNTIRYSNPGIRDIQHGAAMHFTKLITFDALYWKGTDAMSFYDVYGDIIGGIGSYPCSGSPYYHQSTDLLENENHQLITETCKTTVATHHAAGVEPVAAHQPQSGQLHERAARCRGRQARKKA